MAAPRLVLFGAGASYGSHGIVPCSPPLGTDLFGALRRAFPATWGTFSPSLGELFDEHFEKGMQALAELYPKAKQPLQDGAPSPNVLMQDMARYFLSFELAPGFGNLYSTFLLQLLGSDKGLGVSFATLNYEHMLERAMAGLGLKPAVLRPHGGCQLWPHGGGQIRSGPGHALGLGLHSITARVRATHALAIHVRLNQPGQALYPCMAMYMPGKVTQVGQRYLRRAQVRLRRRVKESATIVLIGVRPWDDDDHIWPTIYRSTANVLYVGGTNDYERLATARVEQGNTVHVATQFDAAIPELLDAM